MKIYIAYKLSKLPNSEKQALRPKLERISGILTQMGHETFIMGRDAQKWTKENNSSLHTLSLILKNLRNYDAVLALIDSPVRSMGLLFELTFAKFTGKKIKFALKEGISPSLYTPFSRDIIRYNDMDDLENKLNETFK